MRSRLGQLVFPGPKANRWTRAITGLRQAVDSHSVVSAWRSQFASQHVKAVVSAANEWRTMCSLFFKEKEERRECMHFGNHTHRYSVTFHLRQAAAFNVSSGKWGVSVIAYISLSLVEISTAVSVFTVKALPVALLLSPTTNENSVPLCRILGFCFRRLKHALSF